ncbi:MAG: NAD(P)/FAD-dependent oxidoreductase [Marinifilaceae bacterium]
METKNKPKVIVLGCNFAGLTTARYIREMCKEHVDITIIDKKNYISFIPNIPIEVFENHDPEDSLQFPFKEFLKSDHSHFIMAEVTDIDPVKRNVIYTPNERPGGATQTIAYDYLVIALGCRLAYDKIEGFAEFGYTFSDTYNGNKIRNFLHNDYKGGPIVVGSDRFLQGSSPKLPPVPHAVAACEGPPVELAFSLADWLEKHKMGDAHKITLFTPGEIIAEDAGKTILGKLLPMMQNMGYGYVSKTQGIKRIYKEGIEFQNGTSLEAELKIVFPNWEPHAFMKKMPFVDTEGFVITDMFMHNPDYPEIFAVGDAAALTVPKLGALGHAEALIVAKMLAKLTVPDKADLEIEALSPMVVCFGDMGNHKGFYMHTNEWWGGDISVMQMGYLPYMMKMSFKNMYHALGGKIPSWGMPTSEAISDHIHL